MGRYRRILVAVDGSEAARQAFRQACRLAIGEKSWIRVLTTIPNYADQFQTLQVKESAERALRKEGERAIEEIRSIAEEEGVFISTRLEEGTPFDTIIDAAEEGNYDLIVMGSKGMADVERALVGSVTARVIGNSQRDVLVVPKGTSLAWNTIVVATDGSRYSRGAIDKAIDLARAYTGRLLIVSVVDVTDEFFAQAPDAVEKLLSDARTSVEVVLQEAANMSIAAEPLVREGDAHDVITNLARNRNAGVIIMGSHGRTGIRRLLMGSVTEKVIGYAPCPVLVVRASV